MRGILFGATCAFASLCALAHAQTYSTEINAPAVAAVAAGAVSNMYTSTCDSIVAATSEVSIFCAGSTDPLSVAHRTYPANYLSLGKSFSLRGGGVYSAPLANTVTATIATKVGAANIGAVITGAVPVAANQGVDFHEDCYVATTTTIKCTGVFTFLVLGAAPMPISINTVGTFDPTVANTIDVVGSWNGTVTTQTTTFQTALLDARD
jgi:hypothetical protein